VETASPKYMFFESRVEDELNYKVKTSYHANQSQSILVEEVLKGNN
jgi:energy-coupling factor transporter ATP-binding protein EcfA2